MSTAKKNVERLETELDLFIENEMDYLPDCNDELPAFSNQDSEAPEDEADSVQDPQWMKSEKKKDVNYLPVVVILIVAMKLIEQMVFLCTGSFPQSLDEYICVIFVEFMVLVCFVIILLFFTPKTSESVKTMNFGELKIVAPDSFGFSADNTEWSKSRMRATGEISLDIEMIRFEELKSDKSVKKLKNGEFFKEQYKNMKAGKYKTYEYRCSYPGQDPFCVQSFYCTDNAYYKLTMLCPEQKASTFSNQMIKMISWTKLIDQKQTETK